MEKYDENLKKEFYDEKSGLWYELQGDYYYPMIAVQKQEKILIGKYGRARLNYIKQAQECFTTISEMFDRSENFNNMIIYPEAEFVKKDKNRESLKQALKQTVDLINLDFENDSLVQISTIINRIYRELLLNEKRMAKELKALNEATKNNREKHRR